MKHLLTRGAVAAAAVAGFAVAAAGPALAFSHTVNQGHVDVVKVVCDTSGYDVHTFIEDNANGPDEAYTGTGADQVGDYLFSFDDSADGSLVGYSAVADRWTVGTSGTAESTIPHLGFDYEVLDDAACPESVSVSWSNSGDGASDSVEFNGATSVNLAENSHAHGTWTFDDAASYATYNYSLSFNVPAAGVTHSPVLVRIQP